MSEALIRLLYPTPEAKLERFLLGVERIEEYSQLVLREGTESEKAQLRQMLNDLHVALNGAGLGDLFGEESDAR